MASIGQVTEAYNAKDVAITIDGVIMFGFQDGDMVSFAKTNPNIEVSSDAQGTGMAAINNDSLGTFTLNLVQGSPCFKKLMDLANTQKAFAMSVEHKKEQAFGSICYVEKPSDGSFGKSVPTRSFTIHAIDYQHVVS